MENCNEQQTPMLKFFGVLPLEMNFNVARYSCAINQLFNMFVKVKTFLKFLSSDLSISPRKKEKNNNYSRGGVQYYENICP